MKRQKKYRYFIGIDPGDIKYHSQGSVVIIDKKKDAVIYCGKPEDKLSFVLKFKLWWFNSEIGWEEPITKIQASTVHAFFKETGSLLWYPSLIERMKEQIKKLNGSTRNKHSRT